MDETRYIVSTPSLFKVDEKFDDPRFMRVRIAVMHSGENRNGTSFSANVIKKAKDTFANIPVLAYVQKYQDENGNTVMDYKGHEMHMENDAFHEGQQKIIYDERVVGVVPEKNNFEIQHDDTNDADFAVVDALIYRDYGNYVADILEDRGGKTDVSAEIFCQDLSVNAESGVIDVGKMVMSGVTLLGEDVTPAMTGANASVFSEDPDERMNQLVNVIKELNESLNHYSAVLTDGNKNPEEGGLKSLKFNELLEKYGKKAEDVTFEYEGLSDEELEAKFAEAFGESSNSDENEPSVHFEISVGDMKKDFSVSLADKINALYTLVNQMYSTDTDWYKVDVFDDDKYVIMVNYADGKAYKQNYKVRSDDYTLTGDRVPVKAIYVTADEEKKLDDMRANYSAISTKLGKYEELPKKDEILNSEVYSSIAEDPAFIELKNNHFDYSIEEVSAKADEILLNAAKQHKLTYSTTPKNGDDAKPLPPMNHKNKRFGSLFDGII